MGWFHTDTAPTPHAPAQSLTDRLRGLLDVLAQASRQASGVVSPNAYSALRRIDDILRPLIDDLEGRTVLPEHEATLEQFIGRFVPDTLTLFLDLPTAEQADGGRGDTLLIEQLTALERGAHDLTDTIQSDTYSALETNAYFLKEALQ